MRKGVPSRGLVYNKVFPDHSFGDGTSQAKRRILCNKFSIQYFPCLTMSDSIIFGFMHPNSTMPLQWRTSL